MWNNTFDDRTGSQDRALGSVEDRGVEQRTAAAGIGDGEGSAGQGIGGDAARSGQLWRPAQSRWPFARWSCAGRCADRHDKAFGTVDGNPQAYRVVIRDLGGIVVDRRVQPRGVRSAPPRWL